MRVVCIDDTTQGRIGPHVKKGNIYTVIEEVYRGKKVQKSVVNPEGIYYVLAECGKEYGYHSSLFIIINEDQKDETTFERNYDSSGVTSAG